MCRARNFPKPERWTVGIIPPPTWWWDIPLTPPPDYTPDEEDTLDTAEKMALPTPYKLFGVMPATPKIELQTTEDASYSGVYWSLELWNDGNFVEGDVVGEYIPFLDEPTLPSQEQRNGYAAQLVADTRHFRALYDMVHDLSHLRNEMAKLRGVVVGVCWRIA